MASNLGPLVALKGTLGKEHMGTPWPLGPTQLLLARNSSDEIFMIEFSSERKVRFLEQFTQPIWIYIAQVIREDALIYFGFSSLSERSLFEEIKEIKDVGPKTSATLVAELDANDFLRLMNEGAWRGLKIAGVGPKTLDSLVFGLNKRKKTLLPLLDQARRASSEPKLAVSEDDAEINNVKNTVKNNAEKKSPSIKNTLANDSAEAAPVQSWKPSLYASESLVKMFEGLGLQASQTHALFDECSQNTSQFRDLTDQQRVPVMLQRWGQTRLNAVTHVAKALESETL